MKLMRVCLTALMLVSVAYCSQLLDQYEQQHEDGTRPTGHTEATDRAAKNLLGVASEKHAVPELQVGCADGLFSEKKVSRKRKIRKRAVEEMKRKRRGYYEWQGSVVQAPPVQSFTVWQPPVYQLSRPYFIPVWGGPGRIPLYFPPQPILIKPPYPGKEYLPPKGYLPPSTTIGFEDDVTTTVSPVNIGNRIKEDDFVWDSVEAPRTTTQRSIIPTRRTRRPGQSTTFAPLVHRTGNQTSSGNRLSPNQPQTERPSLMRPAQERPSPSLAPPPPQQSRPRTTQRPRQELSRCVWAIISCCSASTVDVSYSCFEQLGCTGAFWDSSPCNGEFARAAIAAATNYYNNK